MVELSRDILRGGYLAAAMSLLEAEAHLMWLEAGLTLTPTGAPYVRSATTQRRTKLVPLDHAYDPRDGYVVPIPRMLSSKHYEAPIWFVRQGGGLGVLAVDVLAPGRRPHIVDGPTLAQLAPPARMSIDVCIEWPGYHKYQHAMQIRSADPYRAFRPPDVDMFLWHIARAVEEFMTHASRRQMGQAAPPHALDVGVGAKVHDVTIVGAVNIQEGRWFPILRLPPVVR